MVNKDGRIVVYCGDDGRGEYVYRFVSDGRYDPDNRAANMTLLSNGTLSVARFDAEGKVTWLPLVFGRQWLTPDFGFKSQADVVIDARLAADLLGATRMDRPEDVQPNEVNGRVYVILTNNTNRKPEDVNAANPRADNAFGHIIEMTPPDGDHAADVFAWEMLVRCGDPAVAAVGALWNPDTSSNGWFASPTTPRSTIRDGCGSRPTRATTGRAPAGPTGSMPWRPTASGAGRRSCSSAAPIGAELCGPCFTPDGETVFVAVQHPAADGAEALIGFGRASTFKDPATRWPDFDPKMPPRPSVLAITKDGGGKIA